MFINVINTSFMNFCYFRCVFALLTWMSRYTHKYRYRYSDRWRFILECKSSVRDVYGGVVSPLCGLPSHSLWCLKLNGSITFSCKFKFYILFLLMVITFLFLFNKFLPTSHSWIISLCFNPKSLLFTFKSRITLYIFECVVSKVSRFLIWKCRYIIVLI